MSRDQPGVHFLITKAREELRTPVEGELRREPVADADVPCPRCGARAWLLVERRAEPHEPFTRWSALACANCGAADGWQPAGRTRRGRAAEQCDDCEVERVPGMPDHPTVADVCRLAPFRVFAPSPAPELRAYTHIAGRLTDVKLASGDVEVTTGIRDQVPSLVPVEQQAENRARGRLQHLLVDWPAVLWEPRSEPARQLHIAAADRQAAAQADAAPARQAMIEVDGVPVAFVLVESEGRWVAAADIDDEGVTVAARGVPITGVALQTVLPD